jgi:hypothetical protein
LQKGTHCECTRVAPAPCASNSGAASVHGGRANHFAAVAAIVNAVTIFSFTVGTFHLSPTLPSPIFGIVEISIFYG